MSSIFDFLSVVGGFISCYFYSHQVVWAWSSLKAGKNIWMYPLKNAPWVLGRVGGFCQWKCLLEKEADCCWCRGRVQSPLWRYPRGVHPSRADPGDVAWSDGSRLAGICLAPCPLGLAHLSHRRHITSEEVTLVWIFHRFTGLEAAVSLLRVVPNCCPYLRCRNS